MIHVAKKSVLHGLMILLVWSGASAAQELKIELQPRVARVLDRPLVTSRGKPVRFLADVVAPQPVLLSFTFTGCVQLCPPSDVIMDMLAERLENAGRKDIRLVTLTLDPMTDTPPTLHRKRAEAMHADRLFLSGNPNDVWAVLEGLGVQPGPNQDHEIQFLLIDSGGRRVTAILGLPDPEALFGAVLKVR
jgi:protein SCO1/2